LVLSKSKANSSGRTWSHIFCVNDVGSDHDVLVDGGIRHREIPRLYSRRLPVKHRIDNYHKIIITTTYFTYKLFLTTVIKKMLFFKYVIQAFTRIQVFKK